MNRRIRKVIRANLYFLLFALALPVMIAIFPIVFLVSYIKEKRGLLNYQREGLYAKKVA